MTLYNWQQPDWPNFQYDLTQSYEKLLIISEKMGLLSGKIGHLSENLQSEAMINLMVEEAVKTSEIEGEYVSRIDVRSSIKNKLGYDTKPVKVHDKRAQGIAELIINTRHTFKKPLTEKKLFDWHLMVMSGSSDSKLTKGHWRTDEEPMQIISGHYEKWVIHFEAPPSDKVPKEMKRFIRWFNETAPAQIKAIDFAPVRAAIAHLYFESIHPFDDGNGRIGRAIAEKALSQGYGYPTLISLSQAIEADKKAYYAALKTASKSNAVTEWIHYFIDLVLQAQIEFEKQINFTLKKARFFDKYKDNLNERQLKIIKRMLQEGAKGFEGGMSAKKYMSITDTSKATATRDLQELLALNILTQIGSGRSVRYELKI
jgi:Fic family protein